MRMLRLLILALLAAVAAQAGARTSVPIVNHENIAVTAASGRTPSAADVAQAIRLAATSQHWEVTEAAPDRMVATLVVRGKHTVATDIQYTPQSISVKYRSSVNMHYAPDGATGIIHPNYNRWVQSLVDAIRVRVSAL